MNLRDDDVVSAVALVMETAADTSAQVEIDTEIDAEIGTEMRRPGLEKGDPRGTPFNFGWTQSAAPCTAAGGTTTARAIDGAHGWTPLRRGPAPVV